ncbi:hypothetical protein KFE98_13315 [bacterium SCSIO 12741]|nr:hypothetical protein KFE98_13315 [bacterium SCSIO 12741]
MILKKRFIQVVVLALTSGAILTFTGDFSWHHWPILILLLIVGIPYYFDLGKGLIIAPITASITLLAIIFKFMHWPGAGPAGIVATFLFGFVYSPLFYLKAQRSAPLWLRLLGLLCLPILSAGWIFKVQHWVGASILLVAALCTGALFLIILFIAGYHKQLKFTRNDIMVHLIFFSLASIVLINTNVWIKVAPNYFKLYDHSLQELHESREEAELLSRIYKEPLQNSHYYSRYVDITEVIQNLKKEYTRALSSELGVKPIQLDSMLRNDWMYSPNTYKTISHGFYYSSFDPSEMEWHQPDFSLQLSNWVENESKSSWNDFASQSQVLNPNNRVTFPKVDAEKEWEDAWFAHASPFETYAFLNTLESFHHEWFMLRLLREQINHDEKMGIQELIKREKDLKASLIHAGRSYYFYNDPFMAVLVVLLLLFVIYLSAAPKIVSDRWFHAITFMLFVLIFEYILFLTMPYWESKFGNQILILFALNAIMALLLVPVHNYFEDVLRKRVTREKDDFAQVSPNNSSSDDGNSEEKT